MTFLEKLKKKYGTQSTYVDDNTLETIRGERENRAEAADRARRVKLAEEALEQARIDKQRWIDSFFGGSSGRADPNVKLVGFMQMIFGPRITGGGITGNDPKKMVIDVQASESDGVQSTNLDPVVHEGWFRRSRPVIGKASIDALNLPKNKSIKERLPPNK